MQICRIKFGSFDSKSLVTETIQLNYERNCKVYKQSPTYWQEKETLLALLALLALYF